MPKSASEPSSGSRKTSRAAASDGRSRTSSSSVVAWTSSPGFQPPCGGWRSATAPGIPVTFTAHRFNWLITRSRTNGIWLRWSFASVNRNRSSSSSMNSRGVHVKTSTPSCRPPVSGNRTSPDRRRGGAQNRTLGNGEASTPRAAHPSAAASS